MTTPFHDVVTQLKVLADELEGHADNFALGNLSTAPPTPAEPASDTPDDAEGEHFAAPPTDA